MKVRFRHFLTTHVKVIESHIIFFLFSDFSTKICSLLTHVHKTPPQRSRYCIHNWGKSQLHTANMLTAKNTTFHGVILPVPFGHSITVPSTVDKWHFQLYFWRKKNHIIQTVVGTLEPV
jgi:hypothetical protein